MFFLIFSSGVWFILLLYSLHIRLLRASIKINQSINESTTSTNCFSFRSPRLQVTKWKFLAPSLDVGQVYWLHHVIKWWCSYDVAQLHAQLQQHTDDEQLLLSTPDSKIHSTENIATDDDLDAALDDLQMTLTGEDVDAKQSPLLNKCPELRAYHLVYRWELVIMTSFDQCDFRFDLFFSFSFVLVLQYFFVLVSVLPTTK